MAKMLGKIVTKGCSYGCCGEWTGPKVKPESRRTQRTRENRNFRKALSNGQDI